MSNATKMEGAVTKKGAAGKERRKPKKTLNACVCSLVWLTWSHIPMNANSYISDVADAVLGRSSVQARIRVKIASPRD